MALTVLATTLMVLRQPDIYQSTATLVPLSPARSGLSTALGELGGSFPAALGFMGRDNPVDRLLAVLQSRTLALEVIQHLTLLPLFFPEQWDAAQQHWRRPRPPTLQDAVRELSSMVSITGSRQGMITLVVSHPDPALSAAIANRYVQALQQALNDKAFSLAKKNRLFIAAQLEKTRQELTLAEETLKQFELQHRIIAIEAQTAVAVEAVARLEEQIRAKEVQLGVQQRLLTGANREVYLLREELRELYGQHAQLQYGGPTTPTAKTAKTPEDQVAFALDDTPDIKMRYARLQREAFVQNKLFTLLAQQLEQAKIDEVRDETTFQVIDRAIPPEKRSKPKRFLTVLLSIPLSAFGGILLAFCREYLDSTVRTKDHIEKQLGLTCLATVPPTPPQAYQHISTGLLTAPRPDTVRLTTPSSTQVLRYLHTRFKHLHGATRYQTVLLVGSNTDKALASFLVELAYVAASTAERTLLVDGNMYHPTLHTALRCAATPGLTEGLADPAHWQQSIQHTHIPHLDFVAAGSGALTGSAALASTALDTLLMQYKAHYDLILCTAAPVLELTDAVVLGSKVDATCLVLTAGTSSIDTVLEAKSTLEAVHANVIGAILLHHAA